MKKKIIFLKSTAIFLRKKQNNKSLVKYKTNQINHNKQTIIHYYYFIFQTLF